MAGEHTTKIEALLQLMGDGQWHYPPDLMAVSHRFGDTIDRARRKGYLIETERIKGNNYRYRLVGHKDDNIWAEFQANWQAVAMPLTGELNKFEGSVVENIIVDPNGFEIIFIFKSPEEKRQQLRIVSSQSLNFSTN